MDFTNAMTEPMASLVGFHNQFNKRIKFSFGALARIKEKGAKLNGKALRLPVGEEPWNQTRTWQNIGTEADLSLQFVTEMGLARAATAFEEYVMGSIAELDRGDGRTRSVEADGNLIRLLNRLEIPTTSLSAQLAIVEFYDCARNCIVHRSGRANKDLAQRAASPALKEAVRASARANAKWKPTIPDVVIGKPIQLQPRHAIMASGAYHRLASMLDKALVQRLGRKGFVRMASYWSLLAENPIHTPVMLKLW